MTTSTALAEQPNSRQIARREASRPLKVTGKLRKACDHLVHDGMPMDEAAKAAGIPTRRLRLALAKQHVRSYLRAEREVLRESMCGRNILTLAEVRDQTDNQMARVQAVKALEQLGDDPQANAQRVQAPGIVIMVGTQPAAAVTIDAVRAAPEHNGDGGSDG